MKPFFSVVIPTLNEEKYLPNLLNDLTKQKEKDFEIIVVDGKSEDRTIDIAIKYKKKYQSKIIISQKRNLCYQRNLGAKNSSGEYLIFLDADIRLYGNYLFELKKTIVKNSYLFLTTYQLSDDKDNFNILLAQIANYGLEILKLINKQMAPGYNFVIFKDIFIKLKGFNEKTTISEDHDLSIRIQNSGIKLCIIPKKLLKWSFRRVKKDGYLQLIIKYGVASFYSILLGEITDKKLGYQAQMGGQYFRDSKTKKTDLKLKKYLHKIENVFNKLTED
ncbi:MAG: glycosyltransferase [Patescibacteria group bacterium]